MKMILLLILIIILLILLINLALFHLAMDSKVPFPPEKLFPADRLRKAEDYSTYVEKLPHEDLSIMSFDGLKLTGYFYPFTADIPEKEPTGAYDRYKDVVAGEDSLRRLVIMCHGWRSRWWIDYMKHFHWIRALGSDILLIDERACGSSEGRFYTYGVNESRDILLWAETMHKRFPEKPIYLFGTSLGGASVLQTISPDMPLYIHGIIADSAFTSPYELFSEIVKTWFHLPAHPAVDIVRCYARIIAGVDLKCKPSHERIAEKIALDAKSHHPLRLLLIHGGKDKMVNYQMSEANYAAANGSGNVKYLFVPQAGHCKSYGKASETYEHLVTEMFGEDTRGGEICLFEYPINQIPG